MARWLRQWHLMDMKCYVHDLIRAQTPVGSNMGCIVLLSKSYLNQIYYTY